MRAQEGLIGFVEANFDPEDIWPYVHDECYDSIDTRQALTIASEEGWVNPYDEETYERDNVEEMASRLGVVLGLDQRDAAAYHDDNGHDGAVRWCTHPACNHQN